MKKTAANFNSESNAIAEVWKRLLPAYLSKTFILLLVGTLMSFHVVIAKAQVSISKNWDRAFARRITFCHTLTATIRTSDGGYLLGGYYRNCDVIGIVPSDLNAYWIVKVSSSGALQWERSFGGNSTDQLASVIQTSDGGYLLGGKSLSGISGDRTQSSRGSYDYWVVKITSTGSKQWDKRFGGNNIDELKSVIQASDGGYLLSGTSLSGISGDKTQSSRGGGGDYWVVKISSTGSKLWDRRYGGSGADFLSSAIKTTDGGYLLAGYSSSDISGERTQSSRGGYDYWVVKISSAGSKQWDRRFGGNNWDILNSVVQTSDGGYLLGGRSPSPISGDKTQGSRGGNDYWVVKISSLGTKQWDRRYGGSSDDVLTAVARVSDGGYLLAGSSMSGVGGDKTQSNRGSSDYWIVKINSSGTKQWDRRYGGSAADNLAAAIVITNPFTTNRSYVLAGSSESGISGDRTQALKSFSDYWLVSISETMVIGTVTSNTAAAPNVVEEAHALKLMATPNPFTSRAIITFTMDKTEQVSLQVYDSKGSTVASLYNGKGIAGQSYRFELAANSLPAGMYFTRLQTQTKVEQVKLILVR